MAATYGELRTRTEKIADLAVRERVQRGLVVLHEVYGDDWVDHIDPAELMMGNTKSCILGQIEGKLIGGGYQDGLTRIDGMVEEAPWDYGFDALTGSQGDGYGQLDAAWRLVLGATEEES